MFKAESYRTAGSVSAACNYHGWNTYIFRSFVALSGRQLKPAVLYTTFTAGTKPIQPFYHLVITGEPSQDDQAQMAVRYYVNGKLRSTREGLNALNIGTGCLPSPKTPITIGKFSSNSCQWFNGILDEVKCFNRTLTADEIAAEYKAVSTVTATGDVSAAPELKPIVFPAAQKSVWHLRRPAEPTPSRFARLEWFEEQPKIMA